MRILVFALLLCLNQMALAEYRVFRLSITQRAPAAAAPATLSVPAASDANNAETITPNPGREVISTLDPDQYRGYYQVRDDEVVTYTQTWMCRGRTGDFKDPCPAPAPVAANPPVPAASSNNP